VASYPINPITLGTNDPARAAAFYDAVVGVLGFARLAEPADEPPAYATGDDFPYVYLYRPIDGRPATWSNGTHVAFMAERRSQVHAFHEAALEAGGSDERTAGPAAGLRTELD
jgi:catechol 2,3-dioxygenase-like lactoylglutathione lyase family enzyme